MWAYGGSVGGGQDDNEVIGKFNGVFKSLVKITLAIEEALMGR